MSAEELDTTPLPSTQQMRNTAAFGAIMANVHTELARDPDWPSAEIRSESKVVFDEWLAEHDKEVDRLRKVISDARHDYDCGVNAWLNSELNPLPCNCFKTAAAGTNNEEGN
jgi:hypothetical protein